MPFMDLRVGVKHERDYVLTLQNTPDSPIGVLPSPEMAFARPLRSSNVPSLNSLCTTENPNLIFDELTLWFRFVLSIKETSRLGFALEASPN